MHYSKGIYVEQFDILYTLLLWSDIIEGNYHEGNWSWVAVKKASDAFPYEFNFVHNTIFFPYCK